MCPPNRRYLSLPLGANAFNFDEEPSLNSDPVPILQGLIPPAVPSPLFSEAAFQQMVTSLMQSLANGPGTVQNALLFTPPSQTTSVSGPSPSAPGPSQSPTDTLQSPTDTSSTSSNLMSLITELHQLINSAIGSLASHTETINNM